MNMNSSQLNESAAAMNLEGVQDEEKNVKEEKKEILELADVSRLSIYEKQLHDEVYDLYYDIRITFFNQALIPVVQIIVSITSIYYHYLVCLSIASIAYPIILLIPSLLGPYLYYKEEKQKKQKLLFYFVNGMAYATDFALILLKLMYDIPLPILITFSSLHLIFFLSYVIHAFSYQSYYIPSCGNILCAALVVCGIIGSSKAPFSESLVDPTQINIPYYVFCSISLTILMAFHLYGINERSRDEVIALNTRRGHRLSESELESEMTKLKFEKDMARDVARCETLIFVGFLTFLILNHLAVDGKYKLKQIFNLCNAFFNLIVLLVYLYTYKVNGPILLSYIAFLKEFSLYRNRTLIMNKKVHPISNNFFSNTQVMPKSNRGSPTIHKQKILSTFLKDISTFDVSEKKIIQDDMKLVKSQEVHVDKYEPHRGSMVDMVLRRPPPKDLLKFASERKDLLSERIGQKAEVSDSKVPEKCEKANKIIEEVTTKLQRRLEEARQESSLKRRDSVLNQECMICYDAPMKVLNEPCMHGTFCIRCAVSTFENSIKKLKYVQCPLCRKVIDKIYLLNFPDGPLGKVGCIDVVEDLTTKGYEEIKNQALEDDRLDQEEEQRVQQLIENLNEESVRSNRADSNYSELQDDDISNLSNDQTVNEAMRRIIHRRRRPQAAATEDQPAEHEEELAEGGDEVEAPQDGVVEEVDEGHEKDDGEEGEEGDPDLEDLGSEEQPEEEADQAEDQEPEEPEELPEDQVQELIEDQAQDPVQEPEDGQAQNAQEEEEQRSDIEIYDLNSRQSRLGENPMDSDSEDEEETTAKKKRYERKVSIHSQDKIPESALVL